MLKGIRFFVFAVVFALSFASLVCAASAVQNTDNYGIKEYNSKALNQEMWLWASMEEELSSANHGGPVVVSPVEAENQITVAMSKIRVHVSLIMNAKDLASARILADDFVELGASNEIVGNYVNKQLDIREKFLVTNGVIKAKK